jgi:2,3-bisphosphoglycerate-independent phosphoglycerate mutase
MRYGPERRGRGPLDAWPAELKSSRQDMGIRCIVQIF